MSPRIHKASGTTLRRSLKEDMNFSPHKAHITQIAFHQKRLVSLANSSSLAFFLGWRFLVGSNTRLVKQLLEANM